MIKKLFALRSQSILQGALLIAFFALLSRLLGVFRAHIFAEHFGASTDLDIFYLSFRIPDLLFSILMLGGASSVLIPALSDLLYGPKKMPEKANRLISNSITTIFIIIAVLSGAMIVTLPWLVHLIAPGLDEAGKHTVIILTTIMLIQPLFLVLSDLFSSVLQVHKIFLSYSIAPILYNVGIIFGALYLTDNFGVYGLGIGVVLGAFLHMTIHTIFFHKVRFKYWPVIDWKDPTLQSIVKQSIPRSLGLMLFQLNFLIINSLASRFGEGYVSILNYANDIEYVPYGVIGIAFATSSFAYLSHLSATKNVEKFGATLTKSVGQLLFFVVPITLIFFILREEIVRVLLQIGRFKEEDVALTSKFIALTIFVIPFQALIPLFTKTFYALKNTATPIIANGAGLLITLGLGTILGFKLQWGFWGLAYALLIAGIINVVIFIILIHRRIQSFTLSSLTLIIGRLLIPLLSLALFAYLANHFLLEYLNSSLVSIFFRGIIVGAASIVVYVFAGYFFNIEESRRIVNKLLSYVSINKKPF